MKKLATLYAVMILAGCASATAPSAWREGTACVVWQSGLAASYPPGAEAECRAMLRTFGEIALARERTGDVKTYCAAVRQLATTPEAAVIRATATTQTLPDDVVLYCDRVLDPKPRAALLLAQTACQWITQIDARGRMQNCQICNYGSGPIIICF